jgi:hypothetical protein
MSNSIVNSKEVIQMAKMKTPFFEKGEKGGKADMSDKGKAAAKKNGNPSSKKPAAGGKKK